MDFPVYRYENGVKVVLEYVKVTPREHLACQLGKYTWFKHTKTHQIYATYNSKRVYLQDVIKRGKGPWAHVDGDALNYQTHNLVKVPPGTRTVKRTKDQTSPNYGVCYITSRDRFRVMLQGKTIGHFKTLEEAQAARVKAIIDKYPMIQFVKEGVDPDGPSGMFPPENQDPGNRPDFYTSPDDIDSARRENFCPLGTQFLTSPTFVAVPPPADTVGTLCEK